MNIDQDYPWRQCAPAKFSRFIICKSTYHQPL